MKLEEQIELCLDVLHTREEYVEEDRRALEIVKAKIEVIEWVLCRPWRTEMP